MLAILNCFLLYEPRNNFQENLLHDFQRDWSEADLSKISSRQQLHKDIIQLFQDVLQTGPKGLFQLRVPRRVLLQHLSIASCSSPWILSYTQSLGDISSKDPCKKVEYFSLICVFLPKAPIPFNSRFTSLSASFSANAALVTFDIPC